MNAELKKERAIDLIVSIFHYGKFKAETPNEKELETILRELRLWPTSESEIVRRSEWYESQPLTEGEGETRGCRDCLCVDEVSDWCKGECLCHHKSQENKECEHPNEFQQLGIDKDERGTLYCIKCGYYRFSQPQQESNKEEEVPQKILVNEDIIGTCKKGFRVTKEEEKVWNRENEMCHGTADFCIAHGQNWMKCTKKQRKEPSKKPMCYCGHPKERHFVQYKSLVEGNQLSCRHCECFEYADDELHNQGKI